MKIKYNYVLSCLFINNKMSFNIDKERIELIQVINDNTFDFLQFSIKNVLASDDTRANFLWLVLKLTIVYPQVELYLKKLLNYFTINELKNIFDFNELNNIFDCWYILHYMCRYPLNISLNSFKIIMNYGIGVNIKNRHNNTPAHLLFYNECNNHTNDILNLLIKYGTNLNIINNYNDTVLDRVVYFQKKLSEETKKCIMTIIDCGGTTNRKIKYNVIYDFIEYYKCLTIKPAIKK